MSIELSKLNNNQFREYLEEVRATDLRYNRVLNLPNNITFGFEFEFDNLNYDQASFIINDYMENKYLLNSCYSISEEMDYSDKEQNGVGKTFYELKTPILTDNLRTWVELENILDAFSSNGAKTDEKTGLHIHIGGHIVEKEEHVSSLIKLFSVFEPVILGFGRTINKNPREIFKEGNKYNSHGMTSSKLISKQDVLEVVESIDSNSLCSDIAFTEFMFVPKIRETIGWTNFKYQNILKEKNNPYEKHTIEFRFFDGTLKPNLVQNNLKFVTSLITAITDDKIDIEKLEFFYKLYKDNPNNRYPYELDNRLNYNNEVRKPMYNKHLRKMYELNVAKALTFADLVFNEYDDKTNFLNQYFTCWTDEEIISSKEKVARK